MVGSIHIMGIVNATPDSFFAGSRAAGEAAADRALALLVQGADVIDLGACSTRPGSAQPTLEEEWQRLEPALKSITRDIRKPIAGHAQTAITGVPGMATIGSSGKEGIPGASLRDPIPGKCPRDTSFPLLSVDTYRAEIVRRAYDTVGPILVNDISAGALDPQMLGTVGRLGLPYVAMHMRGTPETMQQFTRYDDLVQDILAYFRDFAARAADAGIRDWILDPGFGFSKTLEQNYELLRRLEELQAAGRPVLAGLSRKSMVYKVLGITPEEAMPATQVVQYAALQGGATWLRTHDVAEAVQTARVFLELKGTPYL